MDAPSKTAQSKPVFPVMSTDDSTGTRLLELVERNAERGRGTYVEPGWIVGYMAGMMGDETGVEAVEDALAEPSAAA